jgi:signal transduction histidine kinase
MTDQSPPPAPPAARPGARGGRAGSIEVRLPLLIAALLAAVVGAFGAAAYREVRVAAVERATGRLAGVAQQLAATSGANSAARLAVLRALAADPAVVRAADTAADGRAGARLGARLAAARRPSDSTLVAWELWALDGPRPARRFRTGAAATPRDSAVLAETLGAMTAADPVRRSPFYHSGARVAVWTVVPVDAGGRTAGFLAERRQLASTPRSEQTIRELTGEDVAVLVTSRGSAEWATIGGAARRPPFALPNAPAAGAPAAALVRDARGERHYVAQAAVPQSPWVLVLAEPEAAVLRRPRGLLNALLGAGALVLAVGGAGAWLLGRHVARPLVAVTRAAEGLAEGDYGQRVPVDGGGEPARLAATFNAMAARLGEAHAALAERNAELQRANAAKAQFLAMMSHELRTPLNAVGGYTELMALGLRGPVTAAQLEDLARIRRSKDHLLSIINDLLSFARADAGHLTVTPAPVAARDVLVDVESLVGPQFAAKGVGLRIERAPADAVARADREKLQQVVLNLVTNALQFTPAGGSVTAGCAVLPDAVRFVVRDTGWGSPATGSTPSSSRSCRWTRRSRAAWAGRGSGWPSSGRSWGRWAARSRWRARSAPAPRSRSRCRARTARTRRRRAGPAGPAGARARGRRARRPRPRARGRRAAAGPRLTPAAGRRRAGPGQSGSPQRRQYRASAPWPARPHRAHAAGAAPPAASAPSAPEPPSAPAGGPRPAARALCVSSAVTMPVGTAMMP